MVLHKFCIIIIIIITSRLHRLCEFSEFVWRLIFSAIPFL